MFGIETEIIATYRSSASQIIKCAVSYVRSFDLLRRSIPTASRVHAAMVRMLIPMSIEGATLVLRTIVSFRIMRKGATVRAGLVAARKGFRSPRVEHMVASTPAGETCF